MGNRPQSWSMPWIFPMSISSSLVGEQCPKCAIKPMVPAPHAHAVDSDPALVDVVDAPATSGSPFSP